MGSLQKVRIDKWLWAIRIYKTRTLASDACKAGKVKINGKSVKPSYNLQVGETIHIQKGINKKIYKALNLIEKRVAASLAAEAYEDLSPPEIQEKKTYSAFFHYPGRDKGAGRPTKKERRDMDKWKGE